MILTYHQAMGTSQISPSNLRRHQCSHHRAQCKKWLLFNEGVVLFIVRSTVSMRQVQETETQHPTVMNFMFLYLAEHYIGWHLDGRICHCLGHVGNCCSACVVATPQWQMVDTNMVANRGISSLHIIHRKNQSFILHQIHQDTLFYLRSLAFIFCSFHRYSTEVLCSVPFAGIS